MTYVCKGDGSFSRRVECIVNVYEQRYKPEMRLIIFGNEEAEALVDVSKIRARD